MKTLFDVLNPELASDVIDHDAPPVKLTAKNFSKGILESPEYRASLMLRIVSGTLPPAVECRILDHALGKPVERVEVKDQSRSIEDLSPELVKAKLHRVQRMLQLLETSRTNVEVHPAASEDDDGPRSSSVH